MKRKISKILFLLFLGITFSCTTIRNNGSLESQDANIQVFNSGINRLNLNFNNPQLLDLGAIDHKWKGQGHRENPLYNLINYNLQGRVITFSNPSSTDTIYLTPFNNSRWLRFKCDGIENCGGGGNIDNYTMKAIYSFCYNKSDQVSFTRDLNIKGFIKNTFDVNFSNNVVDLQNNAINNDFKIENIKINGTIINNSNNNIYTLNSSQLINGINTIEVECFTTIKVGGDYELYLNMQGDILLTNKCSN